MIDIYVAYQMVEKEDFDLYELLRNQLMENITMIEWQLSFSLWNFGYMLDDVLSEFIIIERKRCVEVYYTNWETSLSIFELSSRKGKGFPRVFLNQDKFMEFLDDFYFDHGV